MIATHLKNSPQLALATLKKVMSKIMQILMMAISSPWESSHVLVL
jgi:hypothetical protein